MAEFLLKRKDVLIGTLRSYSSDFPWTNCKFEPTEEFQKFKPLFDEEIQLVEKEDWENHDKCYKRIDDLKFEIINLNEEKITKEFLLHIQGDEAWFRM